MPSLAIDRRQKEALAKGSYVRLGSMLRRGFEGDEAELRSADVDVANRVLANQRTSSRQIDSHRTIIRPQGIKLARYKRNPTLLLAHDRYSTPIGRALDSRTDADGLLQDFEFDDEAESLRVFGKYQRRMMRGWSVGGMVLAANWVWDNPKSWSADLSAEEREALELEKVWGIILEFELAETSACAVPSNAWTVSRDQADLGVSERLLAVLERLEGALERLEVAPAAVEARAKDPAKDPDVDGESGTDDANPDPAELEEEASKKSAITALTAPVVQAAAAPTRGTTLDASAQAKSLQKLLTVAVQRGQRDEAARLVREIHSLVG